MHLNSHPEFLGLGDPSRECEENYYEGPEGLFRGDGDDWPRFIRDHILPAIRACGSLREIRWFAALEEGGLLFAEVEKVLKARRRRGEGGAAG